MLKQQMYPSSRFSFSPLVASKKMNLHRFDYFALPFPSRGISIRKRAKNVGAGKIRRNGIRAQLTFIPTKAKKSTIAVKAIITVKNTVSDVISSVGIEKPLDVIRHLLGKTILVELVSAELDPITGLEKDSVQSFAYMAKKMEDSLKYESDFEIPKDFGEIGALLVVNEHRKEKFLQDVVLEGLPGGPITIHCSSWIHSKYDNPEKRVFFLNKAYLPFQTPNGLKTLREKELRILRGNGEGERKKFDRIYDYDFYNDLGEPDKCEFLKRPVLGGKERPYPRRCRTGRPQCETEKRCEGNFYVPRDEAFSEVKQQTFSARTFYCLMQALIPSMQSLLMDKDCGFPYFSAIDLMFSDGLLGFEPPETVNRDKSFWFRDEEFSRQTLAGLNPCSIRLVTEWPLKSTLDPEIYGPPECAITEEMIENEIKGGMTIHEIMKQKKLFILDYHDVLLPYVKKVRELKGTTLYGSRTLFILNPDGTLSPLLIELTRPPMHGMPQWKQVFFPSGNSTSYWLWRIAKAHVLAHDSGYHQLVNHWLRTHCVTEPYIIATNRQLSAMHPIYKLLRPHFRHTIKMNALARESLINAGGIIETSFSPGKYSMELSSVAYDKEWQFDLQSLPADLISRGMAVEDFTASHGLRLTIEDYPFANDGLLIWDAIKEWVTYYICHYYPNPNDIQEDEEIQAWWTEIRTVGHEDKKDEPWWPTLQTPQDLIDILTTMIWVTSGQHAAVNFGQYTYGAYFPNRPTIARTKMPTENPTEEEWKMFLKKPEHALLNCFPSKGQATKIMAVLDVLSNHSPDEEYIGDKMEPAWAQEPVIKMAFERFNKRLKEIERLIDDRNMDTSLRNRNGAGVVPYELLKPFSGPGITGKGIPMSVST